MNWHKHLVSWCCYGIFTFNLKHFASYSTVSYVKFNLVNAGITIFFGGDPVIQNHSSLLSFFVPHRQLQSTYVLSPKWLLVSLMLCCVLLNIQYLTRQCIQLLGVPPFHHVHGILSTFYLQSVVWPPSKISFHHLFQHWHDRWHFMSVKIFSQP